MPTKVFDQLDANASSFTVGADGFVNFGPDGGSTVALSTLLIEDGAGSWHMNPNLNSTGVATSPNCGIASVVDEALIQTWSVNFGRVSNPIPDTAQIKKLVFRRPRIVNYSAAASDAVGNAMNFGLYDATFTRIYFTPDPPESQSGSSPLLAVESITGSDADEVLFDFTAGPSFITKQELIDNWSDFNNNVFAIGISAGGGGIGDTSDLIGSLTFGDGWTVTVTYEEGFQWDISPEDTRTVQPADGVNPGTEITVTSDSGDPNAIDFEQIETATVILLDEDGTPYGTPIDITEDLWLTLTTNTWVFTLPVFNNPVRPKKIIIRITSTQFSGSVDLQTYITIFITNAPGIYKLVVGQHYDTLYDRTDENDVVTINTKIPNPFIKTGFING